MKILVVSPVYPYPPIDGHKNRIYNLFRHFPTGNILDFIAFGDADKLPAPDALRTRLGPCFRNVELISHGTLKKIDTNGMLSRLKNIYYPMEQSIGEPYLSGDMMGRIREKIAIEQYDLVFLCGLYISLHHDRTSEVPYVVDISDSISLLLKSYFQKEHNPLKKCKKMLNYVWADRYEKIHCSRIKNMIMISEIDAGVIRKNCPHSRIWVVPNGVDMEYFRTPISSVRKHQSLLFTGVMDYPPNNDAMVHFLKKIYPMVSDKYPDISLTIAGRNPTDELKALSRKIQGVRLTGLVDDLRPYFQSAAIYVSPLISGAGMKNKILEAWSMTMPVVATSASCSGIEVRNGVNILIADSPDEFARKVILLLGDESLRVSLSKNGRSTVERLYSWQSSSQRLMDIFARILANDMGKKPMYEGCLS